MTDGAAPPLPITTMLEASRCAALPASVWQHQGVVENSLRRQTHANTRTHLSSGTRRRVRLSSLAIEMLLRNFSAERSRAESSCFARFSAMAAAALV
jgi:hypothetical protein